MWVQTYQFLTQADRLPPETKVPVEGDVSTAIPHLSVIQGFPSTVEDHVSVTEVGKEDIAEWLQLLAFEPLRIWKGGLWHGEWNPPTSRLIGYGGTSFFPDSRVLP